MEVGKATRYRQCNYHFCGEYDSSATHSGGDCERCLYISYCSKEHQDLDWEVHKHICSKDPATRIRNFLTILTTPDSHSNIYALRNDSKVCNISFTNLVTTTNTSDLMVNLLRVHGNTICATCYETLQYEVIHVCRTFEKTFNYKELQIRYIQCPLCFSQKNMCPSNFVSRDRCPQKKLDYELFFYSQQIDAFDNVKDINQFLGSILCMILGRDCSCKEIPK